MSLGEKEHRHGPKVNPQLVEIADMLVELLHTRGVLRSCPDCDAWDSRQEMCAKYQARPPAQIIAKGCEEFEPSIPF